MRNGSLCFILDSGIIVARLRKGRQQKRNGGEEHDEERTGARIDRASEKGISKGRLYIGL